MVSLTRYALAVHCSGVYERSFDAIDVGVVNILARAKICSVGQSARLLVIHAAAGFHSVILTSSAVLNIRFRTDCVRHLQCLVGPRDLFSLPLSSAPSNSGVSIPRHGL